MKYVVFIMLVLMVLGCIGLDTDTISEDIVYEPSLAIPVGEFMLQYDDVYDFPVIPPPDNVPVSFTQRDTFYFNLGESFKKRENIQSMFFRLDNTNRFPATVIARIFFIGNAGDEFHLTPSEGIEMPPAELNLYGQVIDYYKEWTDLEPLSADDIDRLIALDRMVVELTIVDLELTPEIRENMQFYYIQCSAGVEADLKIKN